MTKATAKEARGAEARAAVADLLPALSAIDTATTTLEKDPPLAAEAMEDNDLADVVALLQDFKARLGMVERDLTVALGQRLGKTTGNLSDGRQFTIQRGSDRKEWDHDDWKRDVRREVVAATTGHIQIVEDLVDVRTGEVVALGALLHEAVAAAQAVHGAQAPKSTALKALGLYASDYCASSPAGWRFTAIKPTPKTEDTTDA